MDEFDTRTQAILSSLVNQRNTALNKVAELQGDVATLAEKIKQLEDEIRNLHKDVQE